MKPIVFSVLGLLVSSVTFAALPPGECGREEVIEILKDQNVVNALLVTGAINSISRENGQYHIITSPDGYGHSGCNIDLKLNYVSSDNQCPDFSVQILATKCQ